MGKLSKLDNQNRIRLGNMLNVFNELRAKPASCTDISNALNFSNTAAKKIINEMIKANVVLPEGIVEQTESSGRPHIQYRLNNKLGFVAAIDLTNHDILIALANIEMRIIARTVIENQIYITDETFKKIFSALDKLLSENNIKHSELLCIGIGTPGKINLTSGYFYYAPRFENYASVNLREIFKKEFPSEIIIKNDIKLALFGEMKYGELVKTKDDALFLHVDENFGGAFSLNNEVFDGENGFAGEIGAFRHYSDNNRFISYDISINAMLLKVCLKKNIDLEEGLKSGISFELIKKGYMEDDPFITSIVKQSAHCLAVMINNLVNFADFNTIIINGRIMELGTQYLNQVQEDFMSLYDNTKKVRFAYSALKNRAMILGTLHLAIDDTVFKILSKNRSETN